MRGPQYGCTVRGPIPPNELAGSAQARANVVLADDFCVLGPFLLKLEPPYLYEQVKPADKYVWHAHSARTKPQFADVLPTFGRPLLVQPSITYIR